MQIQTPNFGEVTLINFTDLSQAEQLYVLKMRNHPDIKKWMYNQDDISETQHLSFIESLNNDASMQYFVVKKNDNNIGVLYFTDIDFRSQSLFLGLYANQLEKVSKAGTMLMEVALVYINNTLKFKDLQLEVFSSNFTAINLYKKFGFFVQSEKEVGGYAILQMTKKLGN